MKKVLILIVASMLVLPANAQFFDRLIQGAKDAGEQAVQQQVAPQALPDSLHGPLTNVPQK